MFGLFKRRRLAKKAETARKLFAPLIQPFDERIEKARADHASVNHIKAEKREFVHACLRGGR